MRTHTMSFYFLQRVFCTALTLTPLFGLCAASLAQTETPIYSFTGAADGASPNTTLVADSAGNYYGTTFSGGSFAGSACSFLGCGVVFRLSHGTSGWSESAIYTFTGGADGGNPAAGLIFDSSGNLYGTTQGGGINASACVGTFAAPGCGVVFKLAPSSSGGWTESVLYSFKGGNDVWDVEAPLTFDAAGNLYSTGSLGGPQKNCNTFGCGAVFKLTPNGSGGWTESIVHFFTNGSDGGRPFAGVVIDSAGNIFTTTVQGGNLSFCASQGCGTLVEIAPSGTVYHFRVLHAFTGAADGSFPLASPALDGGGNIYAPTLSGGHMAGVCHSIGGCGVIFKETRTASGGFSPGVAYTFTGGVDGYAPASNLVRDSAGNFYGAAAGTPAGGSGTCAGGACGFIYKLSTSTATWTENVVYAFTGGTDGGGPYYANAVTLDASGNIFGTTTQYGIANGCSTFANGCGVAYEIVP